MPPIEIQAIYQLVIATVLGASIGIERSVAGKRAGMRTYALVALGSCLLVVTSHIVSNGYIGITSFDPMRVAAGIVMGIGFIGTGVVVQKGSELVGLTTAAGLWVAAALGIAVGFGLYTLAVVSTVLILIIFKLFIGVENFIDKAFRQSDREDLRVESE